MRANRGSDFSNFSPRVPLSLTSLPCPAQHCPPSCASLCPVPCPAPARCVCVTKPWPRSRTPFPSSLSCRGLIVTLSRIYLFIYSFFLFSLLCTPFPYLPLPICPPRLPFSIRFSISTQDANYVFSLLHFQPSSVSDRNGSHRIGLD